MTEPTMRILSLGAGVQSTTLALMACDGTLPGLNAAIFADTGWEPPTVYQQVDRLEIELREAAIPLYRVSKGNLRHDAIDPAHRYASIPTLEALRKIDRYGVTQTGQQYTGWRAIESKPSVDALGAACALIARIAWPNENDERQANWASKIATDPQIRANTIRQARARAHPDRHNGDRGMWDHVESAIAVLRGAGIGVN